MVISFLKKFITLVLILFGVSILAFIFTNLSPEDPAVALARLQTPTPTPELIETIRVDFGLDKPIIAQYFSWLGDLFSGDLGISYMNRVPVAQNMAELLPTTLILSALTIILTAILTIILSILCARYKDGVFDHIMRWATIVGICVPVFWLGYLLLLAFSVNIPIFKIASEDGIKGYILPVITLTLPAVSAGIRLFRTQLIKEMSSDYVTYMRSCGFSPGYILRKNALRNALPPLVSWLCAYVGYIVAGTAVVETVFSMDGIGAHIVEAVIARDTPTIAAVVLIMAFIFVFFNYLGDFINSKVCPRTVRALS